MLRNRQFHRSFIILKNQDSGYSLRDGKEPAGYVKLEIRKNNGKMQLYIQDMKPAKPQKAIYDVVLVSNMEEVEPVKLTSIQVPDSGRGEYEITFDPADVAETGHGIGDYHALAVVERPLNKSGVLHYPLVGYSDKRVVLDWSKEVTNRLAHMYRASRGNMMGGLYSLDGEANQHLEEGAGSDTLPRQIPDTEAAVFQEGVTGDDEFSEEQQNDVAGDNNERYQDKEEGVIEGNRTDNTEDQINPEILNFIPPDISYIYRNKASKNGEETNFPQTEGLPDKSAAMQEDTDMDAAPRDFYSMQLGSTPYWSKVEEYYYRLFDNHKRVTPFDDAIGEVDWIRVENRNEPVYPRHGVYDHCYPYRNNGGGLDHYLIGLMRNRGKVQYVIYGVPGIYSAAPPMSMHGFSRWLPVKNGYGAGYWLLYIDAVTGNIAYPY